MILLTTLSVLALAQAQAFPNIRLTHEPGATLTWRVGYPPAMVVLRSEKPSGVKLIKEPAYQTAPRYGVVTIGDGPRARHVVAVDEPEDGEWRLYVDANANGDLTDDGDGRWSKKKEEDERSGAMYGVEARLLRASYGTATKETHSAPYELSFYRFVKNPVLQYYRSGGQTGTVSVGDITYKAALFENESDGVFQKPFQATPERSASRPVWLVLESKGKRVQVDVRAPFELDGKVYEAKVARDGSTLALTPTDKPAYKPPTPKQRERPPLLAVGTPAPDFTVYTLAGKPVKLSDFKGKAVVIDFWATWCGPCMMAMPHVEEIWKKAQTRSDVTVLGVCVWDDKASFSAWVPKYSNKYTIPFVFDPAGKDTANSIASKLYNVSGIPTKYVIDKEGKIAGAFVGFKQENDTTIEDALAALGIKL